MDKEAQKRSSDPVQQALRDHKRKWNAAASEFISKMIAFKQGLNGRGNARFGLPVSNIKDPLPPNIITFLTTLSANFEQLSHEAEQIEEQQKQYSEHRRKPQPKQAALENEWIKTAAIKTGKIVIGNNEFSSLLAESSMEQQIGLMGKPWPPPVMSFVYGSPQVNKFWMHNTPSPLDIVFCLGGKVVNIEKGEPHSTKLIGRYELSDLVVELPFGTCQAHEIRVGDEIRLDR